MHQEALTREGGRIFGFLHPPGFLFGGGTGLALQIGHRMSEDFDFFNERALADDFFKAKERELAGLGLPLHVSVNNGDELTIFAGWTKVTFLSYPFPVLLPPVMLDGTLTFCVREIAAMKAYTLGLRGER